MSQSPLASAKPRTLVVDRSFGIQHFVRNLLIDVCDTDAAFSATIAYAMLDERSYDLVITSMDLPRGNHGLDILDAVKASPNDPPTPVIGLIPNGQALNPEQYLLQGFTEVVPVWPNLRELEPTVLRVLNAVTHLQDTLED